MNIIFKLLCCPCILCFHAIRIFYCGCVALWCSAFVHCLQASCCGCLSSVCCCFGCTAYWWDKDFPACAVSVDALTKADDVTTNGSSADIRELPSLSSAGDRDHRANKALGRFRRANRRARAKGISARFGAPSDSDMGDGDSDNDAIPWVRLEAIIIDESQRDFANGVTRKKKQDDGKPVAEGNVQAPALFSDTILPEDIVQGSLGDCWLLSSISALAEFPALIRGIFQTKNHNPYGKYTLTLFDIYANAFVNVEVDTRVPCKGTRREARERLKHRKNVKSAEDLRSAEPLATPRYTGPVGNELWVPLLEKAVAKLLGSYQELEGGRPSKGLKILTGFPVVEFDRVIASEARDPSQISAGRHTQNGGWERQLNSDQSSVISPHSLFFQLRDFDHRKAIMTCSIFEEKRKRHSNVPNGTMPLNGLIEGHAYTLISAAEIGEFKLLKIRNPWGASGEWEGEWGDKSSKWKEHPDVRRKIQEKYGNNSAVVSNADGLKRADEMKSAEAKRAGGKFVDNTGRVGEATSDGVFWMTIEDFDRVFNNVTIAVRDVGFDDIELDPREHIGACCGPLVGCCAGCGEYWCCCGGCKALCCGQEAATEVAGRKK